MVQRVIGNVATHQLGSIRFRFIRIVKHESGSVRVNPSKPWEELKAAARRTQCVWLAAIVMLALAAPPHSVLGEFFSRLIAASMAK